jgi:cytochrome d ubiquinol oxidase subunit II
MAIAAVVFVPIILAYQAWTYWVFRKRLTGDRVSQPTSEPHGLEPTK